MAERERLDGDEPKRRDRVKANGQRKGEEEVHPKSKRPGKNCMDRPLDCDHTDPVINRLIPFVDAERPQPFPDEDAAALEFGKKIQRAYRKSIEAIIETGRLLLEAQNALGKYGKGWGRLLHYLPFGERQAQMLMRIAEHSVLSNPQYVADLPASWATLYELAGMQPDHVEELIKKNAIHPRMTRRDAKVFCTARGYTAMQYGNDLLGNLFLFMSYTTPQEFFDHQYGVTFTERSGSQEWRRIATWISELSDLIDKKREDYRKHEAEEDAKLAARRKKRKTEEDGEWDASAPT